MTVYPLAGIFSLTKRAALVWGALRFGADLKPAPPHRPAPGGIAGQPPLGEPPAPRSLTHRNLSGADHLQVPADGMRSTGELPGIRPARSDSALQLTANLAAPRFGITFQLLRRAGWRSQTGTQILPGRSSCRGTQLAGQGADTTGLATVLAPRPCKAISRTGPGQNWPFFTTAART